MDPLFLQRMQAEVDGQRLENKRQESTLEIAKSEKDRLFTKIKTDEGKALLIWFDLFLLNSNTGLLGNNVWSAL